MIVIIALAVYLTAEITARTWAGRVRRIAREIESDVGASEENRVLIVVFLARHVARAAFVSVVLCSLLWLLVRRWL